MTGNEMFASGDPESLERFADRGPDRDGLEGLIARDLKGPLIALLLYMNEIKQYSRQISEAGGKAGYIKEVIDNALQETERAWAIIKRASERDEAPFQLRLKPSHPSAEHDEAVTTEFSPFLAIRQTTLTGREREVLSLISKGFSNKEGARQLNISPRTFESHRAKLMRKLGARNTADMVRLALLQREV